MFSDQEQAYLSDTAFLLAKSEITDKIGKLLASLENVLVEEAQPYLSSFPEGTLAKAGKISKGEKYRGLPYMVLDYPRLFTEKSVFAFRNMFWWGHFFSTTLHLQGEVLDGLRAPLLKSATSLSDASWYIGVGESPWEYHYGPDNYKRCHDLDAATLRHIIEEAPFIKLSKHLPLNQWQGFAAYSQSLFLDLMGLLGFKAQP